MHELSMCEAIANTVVDRAAGRRVLSVTVRIGYLRQVVPDTMEFAWEMLTAGTALEHGIGDRARRCHLACEACGAVTELEAPVLVCASCGDRAVTLRSGDELTIVSMETAGEVTIAEEAH